MQCGLCGFLIIKMQTALHYAVWCGAMHYYLWCGTVILFCGRFWCDFCGLCSLVNTPISLLFISIMVIFIILATLSNFGQISLNLLPLYLELETTLARMHGKSSGKQLKPQLWNLIFHNFSFFLFFALSWAKNMFSEFSLDPLLVEISALCYLADDSF